MNPTLRRVLERPVTLVYASLCGILAAASALGAGVVTVLPAIALVAVLAADVAWHTGDLKWWWVKYGDPASE